MNIPGKWLLVAVVLVGGGWLGWKRLTRPLGDQKVAYVPASREAGVDGPLRYCIYRAQGGVNGDVVYHLPGRNLDEQIWNDDTYYTSMIQRQWQTLKVKPPTVVTLSYGSTWLLTPRGASKESGLLEDLVGRMARIEARTGAPRRRILLGESMGGLNVLVLGLRHPQRFSRIASLYPGVYVDSPFDGYRRWREAAKRTGADPLTVLAVVRMARTYLATEQEWQAISPLALADRADRSYPALYLSCGLYDKFGNFEGCQALAEKAAARGVQVDWHPMYGGHGATDIASLAAFLVGE